MAGYQTVMNLQRNDFEDTSTVTRDFLNNYPRRLERLLYVMNHLTPRRAGRTTAHVVAGCTDRSGAASGSTVASSRGSPFDASVKATYALRHSCFETDRGH